MASASSVLRALRQRSTHGCSPSISRRPQCTTSWSSTTSTRRRRSPPPPAAIREGLTSGTVKRHRAPQVHERGLQLGADALTRVGGELRLAGEHELHTEQPLDDGFVNLPREVD